MPITSYQSHSSGRNPLKLCPLSFTKHLFWYIKLMQHVCCDCVLSCCVGCRSRSGYESSDSEESDESGAADDAAKVRSKTVHKGRWTKEEVSLAHSIVISSIRVFTAEGDLNRGFFVLRGPQGTTSKSETIKSGHLSRVYTKVDN